ncbi:hypothetical protein C8R44DRAFT_873239 [Mycena epipterygia]|nr:hypothetical protein C8R44DRAFT_873239 [Mycena epipterygia]
MYHSTPAHPASSLGLHILEVPDDITTEIFLRCLPVHGRVRPSPTVAPMLLSQVCSQWRAIAHATTELWRSLDLFPALHYFEPHPIDKSDSHMWANIVTTRTPEDIAADTEALAFIKTWFYCAKDQPLSLTLRSIYHILPVRMLVFVSEFAPRLRRLELQGDMLSQPQLQCTPFPLLQNLSVSEHCDDPSDMPVVIAPSLREICLRGNITLPRTGEYPLLTTIECSDISAEALQITLRRFPHLLRITAQTRTANYREPESTTPFLLESLSLDEMAELGAFTFPRLRHLSLKGYPSPFMLSEFITRSRCILESLELAFGRTPAVSELDSASLDDYDSSSSSSESDSASEPDSTLFVVECLRVVPSVKNLTIDVGDSLHVLLDALSPPESLLPNLTALKLSAWARNIDFERLISVLAARVSPLVSFHLVLHDAGDPFAGGATTKERLESAGITIAWGQQPRIDRDVSARFD